MKYYAPTKISENISKTPEGFLLCVGVPIARTGMMLYAAGETPLETDLTGKVKVFRDEEELFSPKTMASFEGKPFTIRHPEEFVNPNNWKALAAGIIQNVRRGKDAQSTDLLADILVTDAIAIGLIENGVREVSCGYEAEYHQDGEGKGFQTNIVGNHLALVEEGRAGPSYAINDHKGKGASSMSKKFGEKIKSLFAKVADEAAKVAEDEFEKKEEMKDEMKEKEEAKSEDSSAYDELVQMCKDLGSKVEALGASMKQKDEKKDEEKKEKPAAKDEEPAAAAGLEDRLKALELAVQKIMQAESAEAEVIGDDDEGEMAEADDQDAEELTGDTAARVEILAPGLKATKDAKAQALKKAYETKEGREIIDSLSGGKAPAFDSAELFIAASELLKASRVTALAKTKQTHDFKSNLGIPEGVMTPEKINELNATRYGLNK